MPKKIVESNITNEKEQGFNSFDAKVCISKSNMKLNIRKKPSTSSEVLYCAKNEELFTVVGIFDSGKWYQVKNENGVKGFAMSEYMKEVNPPKQEEIKDE